MRCPRCRQGDIYKGKIERKSLDVYICDECDACWLDDTNISDTTFKNLLELYKELDLEPRENRVIDMNYKWKDN